MTAVAVLHHEIDPDDGRPVLLMVHGLMSSRNHWHDNLDRLRQRFRLLRVDLPGHGLSPGAPPALLHPDRLVEALERLRADLGLQRLALCGQSFGAGLTLRYTLRFPERVIGHVFTNATAALGEPDPQGITRRLAPRIAALRDRGATALQDEPVHPRNAIRFGVALRARLVRDADRIDPATYADLLQHGLPEVGLGAQLRRTAVPTLLVNGLWERRFQPLRAAAPVLIPSLSVVDLDGGHSINAERPAEFDAATLHFFAALG